MKKCLTFLVLRTFLQTKNLSNILQYFQVPVVSGCPYSLKLTMANVVKAFPAMWTFITENASNLPVC